MYYPTIIRSVGAGTAVDVQGKTLRLIGNLPCEEGDTVWTDGKVIFGNVTRRGTPLLDDTPRGIPVVADNIYDTTCGYFKRDGNFKNKQIAKGNWVTNSKRIYRHGENDILDAEISTDNGLFVAEWADENRKYKLVDNKLISDGEIIIRKNEQEFSHVKLSSLAAHIENLVQQEIDVVYPDFHLDGDNMSTSADLLLFHIEPDGTWTATVKIVCEAKRMFSWVDTSLQYRTETVEYKHEYIPIPSDSSFRENLIASLAASIREREIPYGFMLNDGETLEECLGRISLGVALRNFFYEYSRPCTIEIEYHRTDLVKEPVIVETPRSVYVRSKISRAVKFTSDNLDNPEIIWEEYSSFAGSPVVSRASAEQIQKPLSKIEGNPSIEVLRSEPVTVQEKLETYILTHLGIGMLFHDVQKTESTLFYDTLEEIRYLPQYPIHDNPETKDKYTFPLQDGYYLEIGDGCTVYDGKNNQICRDKTGMRIGSISNGNNFMITPVGRGTPQSYLLGQREGYLYRVTNNQFEKIGTGLKNCRLREMKNINKAKR